MPHTNQTSPLPTESKRTHLIGAKVTAAQKEYIESAARSAQMTTSDYVLARCFNYQPKARLTPRQEALLAPLVEVRTDIRKFFNALRGLPREERDLIIHNSETILTWIKLLAEVGTKVSSALDTLMSRNELPPTTITSHSNDR